MRPVPRPRLLSFSIAAFRLLLCLYPARTRRLFGSELHEINGILLKEAQERGGWRAVVRLWPHMLADFAAAIASEYLDLLCRSRCNPALVACACLILSGVVWLLIAAASFFDVGWAVHLLQLNLALTMLLAFGLPLVALGVSQTRLSVGSRSALPSVALARLCTASTIATWSVLAVHVT